MCIIAVKPKGIELPSYDTLHTCFENNDDGAGFMYYDADEQKIVIEKGFMTWKSFKRGLKRHDFTADDIVVMHCRIATHGYIGKETTHPFPIANNDRELETTRMKVNSAVAHNGIINIDCEKGLSDTQTYIKQILYPFGAELFTSDHVKKIVELSTQGSKLVLWSVDYGMVLTGKWIDDGGILYSNDTYKTKYVYKYDWKNTAVYKPGAKSSKIKVYTADCENDDDNCISCDYCNNWLYGDAYCGDDMYYCENCGRMTQTNENYIELPYI